MKFDPSKKLSESELKDLLAYIQGSGGTVILSRHAKERMLERGYSLFLFRCGRLNGGKNNG